MAETAVSCCVVQMYDSNADDFQCPVFMRESHIFAAIVAAPMLKLCPLKPEPSTPAACRAWHSNCTGQFKSQESAAILTQKLWAWDRRPNSQVPHRTQDISCDTQVQHFPHRKERMATCEGATCKSPTHHLERAYLWCRSSRAVP